MLKVVSMDSKMILFTVDAWEADCIDKACRWIAENGYEFVSNEITFMGDMVVWVR